MQDALLTVAGDDPEMLAFVVEEAIKNPKRVTEAVVSRLASGNLKDEVCPKDEVRPKEELCHIEDDDHSSDEDVPNASNDDPKELKDNVVGVLKKRNT